LSDYEKALGQIAEKEKEIEKARKAKESAAKASKSAQSTKATAKGKLTAAKSKKEATEIKIASLDPNSEKDAKQIAKLRAEVVELDGEIATLTSKYRLASQALTDANKTTKEATVAYDALVTSLGKLKTEKLDELTKKAEEAGVSIEDIEGEGAINKIQRLG
jgi:chromosome segregation ATPase